MFVLQSCPSYVTALGTYAPPLFITGLIGLTGGTVGGHRLVKKIGDPNIGYGVATTRNGLLGICALITLLTSASSIRYCSIPSCLVAHQLECGRIFKMTGSTGDPPENA